MGPLHILVVDDDPIVRKSVVAQLNTQAHTVETASNGRERASTGSRPAASTWS